MNIRQELPADYDAVYRVVQEAFAGAGHSDGTEQDLVAALRQSGAFVPELSLVAEEDGQILGHILFTRTQVGSRTVPALAPLSVLPAHQRQGTGLALRACLGSQRAGIGEGIFCPARQKAAAILADCKGF